MQVLQELRELGKQQLKQTTGGSGHLTFVQTAQNPGRRSGRELASCLSGPGPSAAPPPTALSVPGRARPHLPPGPGALGPCLRLACVTLECLQPSSPGWSLRLQTLAGDRSPLSLVVLTDSKPLRLSPFPAQVNFTGSERPESQEGPPQGFIALQHSHAVGATPLREPHGPQSPAQSLSKAQKDKHGRPSLTG